MEERVQQLEREVDELRRTISILFFSDRYIFSRDIEMQGGRNIQLSTNTGTQIASASNQLLGFWGTTPVDKPATVSDPSGGVTQDAEARIAIIATIDRLQESGLIA